jgi:hypothetical protein
MKSRALLVLVMLNFALSQLGLAQGNSCFQKPVSYSTGFSPSTVLVGDFNNDGNADFAVSYQGSCESGPGIDVFLGNGHGKFRKMNVSQIDADPYGFAIGDFNGDGNLDLVAALGGCGGAPHQLEVALGNGDGTFQPHQSYSSGREPEGVAVGDFDSDGKVDLVVNSSNNQYLWLGNGDGTFHLGAIYPLIGFSDFSLYSADMNRDGKLDLVDAGDLPNQIIVQPGNGDGTFASPFTYPVTGSYLDLAIGDVNGDGFPDVVAGDGLDVRVYTGNGDGSLTRLHVYSVPKSLAVASGDLTGDGIPDLLVTRTSGAKNVLLMAGIGDGSFSPAVLENVGFYSAFSALADWNHDGLLDVVDVDSADGTVNILINRGTCP